MTVFINCTPHDLAIVDSNGVVRNIPRSGIISRVASKDTVVDVIDGIDVTITTFGDPVDVPDPADGTFFIVSRMVASACPGRSDLLVPGPLVRDDQGRVIGARGFGRV